MFLHPVRHFREGGNLEALQRMYLPRLLRSYYIFNILGFIANQQ